MIRRVLLVASKTGYQVREFYSAAERLGIDLVLATDRCHVLEDPWGDRASPLRFDAEGPELEQSIAELGWRGPFAGIVAVGDRPACIAALCAEQLGLRFHPSHAAQAATDKYQTRERFRAAGMNVPRYRLIGPDQTGQAPGFPCVLKPLHLSGSRGVIRADTPDEFSAAQARIRRMVGPRANLLAEEFIPGREFALEGLLTDGDLQTLAIFDKPDPLDGPFFEETLYTTPSREPREIQCAIKEAAQQAVSALGLTFGPVHAEMRVNQHGVWLLEAAPRPIGGLCSRVLRFEGGLALEDVLLRHALGENLSTLSLGHGAHGVMMIPIPARGIYYGVDGLERAREIADLEGAEITAKQGQLFEPLPEGASYLGFVFARAPEIQAVEEALRRAHGCLHFHVSPALPVSR